jgi:protein-S-isoprenylcysteine O-methyltransferase Ste14
MMDTTSEQKGFKTQVRHFINAHKISTPFVVLSMMAYFDYWGVTAWVYLALHSTYCVMWMIKEYTFRDKRFEEAIHPIAGGIFVFGMLGMYWIAPYLIISTHFEAPIWLMFLSVVLVSIGVFFHYVSDAQKHFVLNIKKGLITDGLFSRSRNPNYFGEMLIYLGFGILAMHWAPLIALAYWWAFSFVICCKKTNQCLVMMGLNNGKKRQVSVSQNY